MLYIFFELVLQHPSGGSIVHPICYHLYTMGTSDSNSAMDDTRPHFTIPFILESDASSIAMGVMLLQNSYPISYFSKAFCRQLKQAWHMSANFMQLLLHAITSTVRKWIYFLLGHPFIILTDYQSTRVWKTSCPKWSKPQNNRLTYLSCSGMITPYNISMVPLTL